jgi:hypothetical protein
VGQLSAFYKLKYIAITPLRAEILKFIQYGIQRYILPFEMIKYRIDYSIYFDINQYNAQKSHKFD